MKVIEWPTSQLCMGCKYADFLSDNKKHGDSAYICELGFYPTDEIKDNECAHKEEISDEEWEKQFE